MDVCVDRASPRHPNRPKQVLFKDFRARSRYDLKSRMPREIVQAGTAWPDKDMHATRPSCSCLGMKRKTIRRFGNNSARTSLHGHVCVRTPQIRIPVERCTKVHYNKRVM